MHVSVKKNLEDLFASGMRGLAFWGGILLAVGGALAFQTFWPAPSTTGTSYSSNNSATMPLAMMGRSACTRPGSLDYEDLCLEKMALNSTKMAECDALNGWMSFTPEHAWAVPNLGLYAVMRLTNTNDYTIGLKVTPYVGSYGGNPSAYGINLLTEAGNNGGSDSRSSMSVEPNTGSWSNLPTFPWISRSWKYTVDASSTTYSFVCAYFRDMR